MIESRPADSSLHDITEDDPQEIREGELVYEYLHSGGFLKLYVKGARGGRMYWFIQAQEGNMLPDWKLHVSVAEADFAKAWDCIANLFMKSNLKTGMKVHTQGSGWPPHMRGREFTVYLYQHHPKFESLGQMDPSFEPTSEEILAFVADVERELKQLGVTSNGCADGDYPLGHYVSLRNEAFVREQPAWNLPESWQGVDIGARRGNLRISASMVYPPNCAGWNAAMHRCPVKGVSAAKSWWSWWKRSSSPPSSSSSSRNNARALAIVGVGMMLVAVSVAVVVRFVVVKDGR